MHLRIGFIVLTPEGLLLAGALGVFLWTVYPRVRDSAQLSPMGTAVALIWVSLCGVAGATLYGIPGTLATLAREDLLPIRRALSFGSFGGYWGVLIGGVLASWAMRRPVLPLLDALCPGVLLGGAVARAAGLFIEPAHGAPLPTSQLALWSIGDMAAHMLPFGVLAVLERRSELKPGTPLLMFLAGYAALRFCLEFFRGGSGVFGLFGPFSWGHTMSLIQMAAGLLVYCRCLPCASAKAVVAPRRFPTTPGKRATGVAPSSH